jgi:tyrosine-protein kinase Etk/Wzc
MELDMGSFPTSEINTEISPKDDGAFRPQLFDVFIVLARARRKILAFTGISLVIGAIIAFLVMKPTFTSIASILPPQAPQSSASALMGQLGALAGLGGAGGLLKNPAELYVGILQSRTITDRVIDRFQLQSRWKVKKLDDARKTLRAMVRFEATKDGLIEIAVKNNDPVIASDLANAFVDELYRMNSTLAISEAAQRRLFFGQQLNEEKMALVAAEDTLRVTQEKTGLINLGDQAEMAIRSIAELRAQISSREVEMQSLRSFATDENPDVKRLQSELDALHSQLNQLQNNQQHRAFGDTQVPAGLVPKEGLQYARDFREVKYHEALYELLLRQSEAARIDEAKSAPIIQVVDRAVPPDRKSGPPRLLVTLGFGFVGFCLACLCAFLRQSLVRLRQVPESAAKLDQLYETLHRRRS